MERTRDRAEIAPPTSTPAEDSGFVIGFSGQRPRRARLFEGGSFRSVAGRFGLNASYVAAAPGDYLICAWIEDGYEDWGPPASATGVRAGTHAADRRVAAPHGAARTYLGRA